jgi:hypothetical protein
MPQMRDRGNTTDEQSIIRARAIVALSYVQILRQGIDADRIESGVVADYLDRIEGHLLQIERGLAPADDGYDRIVHPSPPVVEDMLILEHILHD